MKEIIMPKLGETMEEGYLSKWLAREGAPVKKFDPLFEVMSDKTNFEVEAPCDGFLRKITVPASDKPIPVLTVVGYIADSMKEPLPEKPGAEKTAAPADAGEKSPPGPETPAPEKPAAGAGFVPASPLARKQARELGVNLAQVTGTGPHGRIVEKDVLAAAGRKTEQAARVSAPAGAREVPLSPMRRLIGDRLSRSKSEIPHYYVRKVCDVTALAACRAALKPRVSTITYTDILLKAVADTLREFPEMNATFEHGKLILYPGVNIGLAVSREQGLIVPVLKSVQDLTIAEITAERNRLVTRARADQLSRDELSGGTFTVSNLGAYGVDSFLPIIYQPQVAIMGVGAIRDGVVAEGRTLAIRPLMEVTLSCDHRVVDGSYSAAFLGRLQEVISGLQP